VIIIETDSGAVYELDTETMHIRRDGPVAGTDPDKPDGEWLPITDHTDPTPGQCMIYMFPDGRARITTYVKKVSTR
jgi:hypothetical protein